MNRKEGSGRPRLIKAEENTYLIKELICSQEEAPHTHLAPHKITEQTGIKPLTFLLTYKITGYKEKEKNLMFQMRTCLRPRIRCQDKL